VSKAIHYFNHCTTLGKLLATVRLIEACGKLFFFMIMNFSKTSHSIRYTS